MQQSPLQLQIKGISIVEISKSCVVVKILLPLLKEVRTLMAKASQAAKTGTQNSAAELLPPDRFQPASGLGTPARGGISAASRRNGNTRSLG
jgi:hypothetical protein